MSTDTELVNAAIAAGKLQRIPRGVSGFDPMTGRPVGVKSRRNVVTDEMEERMRSLFFAGETYRVIGIKLGVSQRTAYKWCERLGLARLRAKAGRWGRKDSAMI
jgi:DNA invertase Pin-like site-specific DNA recombinase